MASELIDLGDYFHRLDLIRATQILFGLLILDTIGLFVRRKLLKLEEDLFGAIDWIIGVFAVIFPIYLAGLIMAPSPPVLFFFILFAAVPGFRFRKDLPAFGLSKTNFLFFMGVVLIFLPLLPSFFIKASLPPNFSDEMSYHFWSPTSLANTLHWKPQKDLFNMVPRGLNILYFTTFSLTKSYVMTRVFNALILFSMCTFVWRNAKEMSFGQAGLLFPLGLSALTLSLPMWTTSGFVDFPMAAIASGAAPLVARFLTEGKREFFVGAALLLSMAIGIKYSGVNAAVSLALSTVVVSLLVQRGSAVLRALKESLRDWTLVVSCIWLGGFWYLKNFLVTGNPIFPFLLPCYRFSSECQSTNHIFSGWTVGITLENLPLIFNQLVFDRYQLFIPLSLSLVLSLFSKKTRPLALLIVLAIFFEFLLLRFSTGFYQRYQQLTVLYFCFILVLGAGYVFDRIGTIPSRLFIFAMSFALVWYGYSFHISHMRSTLATPRYEKDFARAKIDVFGFAGARFPRLKSFFKFCERPPGGKPIDVYRFDPELIWYGDEALAHHFFSNCNLKDIFILDPEKFMPLEDPKKSRLLELEFALNRPNFFFISTTGCLPEPVRKPSPAENSFQYGLRRINNWLVCRSEAKGETFLYEYVSK